MWTYRYRTQQPYAGERRQPVTSHRSVTRYVIRLRHAASLLNARYVRSSQFNDLSKRYCLRRCEGPWRGHAKDLSREHVNGEALIGSNVQVQQGQGPQYERDDKDQTFTLNVP